MEDRTIIKCNEDETQCVAPETIQPLINAIVEDPEGPLVREVAVR